MNFYKKYFDTALTLIENYDGSRPLAVYLKSHFANHKKYGGRDRKQITHLCYCYYRLGHAFKILTAGERMLIALFLCNGEGGDWLELYSDNWQSAYDEFIDKRILFIQSQYSFNVEDIFFEPEQISEEADKYAFAKSLLIQPNLFIRVRPGNERKVLAKLQTGGINYECLSKTCIALNNATKIDTVLKVNKEAVIQDYSSQRIAEFLKAAITSHPVSTVWDCCAASGGKSILAKDTLPNIVLTVSDIRASIINNLHQRFKEAGIRHYHAFVADLTNFQPTAAYDLVICDVPCSGSGTWARTPEQLYFFSKDKLIHYTTLQKKIVINAAKAVKRNGSFLYSTCSVYREENEEIVACMLQNTPLQLVKSSLLKGYDIKADTLFAALFINP